MNRKELDEIFHSLYEIETQFENHSNEHPDNVNCRDAFISVLECIQKLNSLGFSL